MTRTDLKNFFGIERRTKYFFHVLVCFCLVTTGLFGLLVIGEKALHKKEKMAVAAEEIKDPFENIALTAKSAIVWDVINDRELFAKNPDLPLPLASLTKVVTALTVESKLASSLDVEITAEYLRPEGDSGLVVGDTWQTDNLRDFTLLTSSNDGAFALAAATESQNANNEQGSQAQFIKAMNDMASSIGLSNSKFFNEHGLDREASGGGAYGSARDMAVLFEYTLKNYPKVLEATRYKNLQIASAKKTYSAENTNVFVDKVPNVIASKTGFTDLAGGNLVVAFDSGLNRPIIISVLGSTEEGRFDDTLKLVEAAMKYISQI